MNARQKRKLIKNIQNLYGKYFYKKNRVEIPKKNLKRVRALIKTLYRNTTHRVFDFRGI